MIIRENTEGEYSHIEHEVRKTVLPVHFCFVQYSILKRVGHCYERDCRAASQAPAPSNGKSCPCCCPETHIVLYCTVLHCTALHCTALHCTALHCTALHCTALHCTALHCTALHCTALYCTVCSVLVGNQLAKIAPHKSQIKVVRHASSEDGTSCGGKSCPQFSPRTLDCSVLKFISGKVIIIRGWSPSKFTLYASPAEC